MQALAGRVMCVGGPTFGLGGGRWRSRKHTKPCGSIHRQVTFQPNLSVKCDARFTSSDARLRSATCTSLHITPRLGSCLLSSVRLDIKRLRELPLLVRLEISGSIYATPSPTSGCRPEESPECGGGRQTLEFIGRPKAAA